MKKGDDTMKTDELLITQQPEDMRDLLNKVELIALYTGMDHREATSMTLLAEEMILALRQIINTFEGTFWMETSEDAFSLHLFIDAYADRESKKKLIALSSTGKNAKPKGFFGYVNAGLEALLTDDPEMAGYYAFGDPSSIMEGGMHAHWIYTYADYQNTVRQSTTRATDEDDDLKDIEKTIIDALADDLSVSVRSGKIEVTATKKLKK